MQLWARASISGQSLPVRSIWCHRPQPKRSSSSPYLSFHLFDQTSVHLHLLYYNHHHYFYFDHHLNLYHLDRCFGCLQSSSPSWPSWRRRGWSWRLVHPSSRSCCPKVYNQFIHFLRLRFKLLFLSSACCKYLKLIGFLVFWMQYCPENASTNRRFAAQEPSRGAWKRWSLLRLWIWRRRIARIRSRSHLLDFLLCSDQHPDCYCHLHCNSLGYRNLQFHDYLFFVYLIETQIYHNDLFCNLFISWLRNSALVVVKRICTPFDHVQQ